MKIFVTGATGFLGRAFCAAAASAGHEILGLCRADRPELRSLCQVAVGSLAEVPWKQIERFAPEAALHLAWIAAPGVYLHSPENDMLVEQSAALFAGLAERGVSHVAGTGTCIEYAPSPAPLREDGSPLAPEFPYSRAKVAASRRLESIATETGIAWSWLRIFYPYGEGEHRDRMPSALMRKVAAGETLELRTPDSIKDYIHVRDAAAAMLSALVGGLRGAVNIGTGEGVRIMHLAEAITRCCGGDIAQVRRSPTPAEDPFPVTVADTSKLRSTGWSPRVSLEEGLARLHQSLRQA